MTMTIPMSLCALAVASPAEVRSQTADACTGQPHCVEVTPFVATVTDFRESTAGYYRVLSVTMRFRNKTDRPLVLGYVQGSGLGTDDKGNRYAANDGSLRGLGVISGNRFDSKFTLRPGETSDARLELSWKPGNQIMGTRYVIELAVREIDPVGANQWELGREHALQFPGFGEAAAAAPARAPEPGRPVEGSRPEPATDPCADKP